MDVGHFYFLSDKYFIDFPDKYLMQNHEMVNVFLLFRRRKDRPLLDDTFFIKNGKIPSNISE